MFLLVAFCFDMNIFFLYLFSMILRALIPVNDVVKTTIPIIDDIEMV